MSEAEVLDFIKDALYTLLWVVSPVLLIALVIGLVIGIFQTLTQVQEMTLTFVPKIILVFVGIIVFLPFMMNKMGALANTIFDRITTIGMS